MSEKRRFQRIDFVCDVEFLSNAGVQKCELVDISLRGALLDPGDDKAPEVGIPCSLVITLDESSDIHIVMQGSIAHKRHARLGMRCENIDSDSMMHLRKLVEYNLGDTSLLERELEALAR